MARVLRTLRAVQWSLLVSILLYAFIGERIGPSVRGVDPALSYIFSTLSVGIVGTILVVRRTLVQRAADSLATQPDDKLSLGHWQTGYIVTYALSEALALFGVILRFQGCQVQQSLLFYIGGFVLILFFWPRQPAAAAASS
jgi:F0F1-type ATP synthase membrane subunit c/vacuolar-type H+-ATPase subunit K